MDIEKPAQIQQQATTGITADLNAGRQEAAAKSSLGQQIQQIGENVYNKYASELGEINAQKDIKEQQDLMAMGAQGHFNNVGTIASILNPAYATSYNQSIDRVAIPISVSQVNGQIQELSQNVKLDTSIPPQNKVQELSKQLNNALPNALENIPDEFKGRVSEFAYAQSTQEISKMMSFTGSVALQQQRLQVFQSIDDIAKLGKSANNVTDATKYIQLSNEAIQGAVANGQMSPEQAKAQIDSNRISILSGVAINKGVTDVKAWNTQNGSPIDKNDLDGIQANIDKANYQQQKQIELNNLKSGVNVDLYLAKLRHGELGAQRPDNMTDMQMQQEGVAKYMGQLYNKEQASRVKSIRDLEAEAIKGGEMANMMKDFTPTDLYAFKHGDTSLMSQAAKMVYTTSFAQLPFREQMTSIKATEERQALGNVDPINVYQIPDNATGNDRLSIAIAHGADPKSLPLYIRTQDVQDYLAMATNDPKSFAEFNGKMATKYDGKMLPIFYQRVQEMGGAGASGLLLAQHSPYKNIIINNPIIDPKILQNKTWVTNLPTEWQRAINNSPNGNELVAMVNRVVPYGSKKSSIQLEVLKNTFELHNDAAVLKGDTDYLVSRDFRDKAKISNYKDVQWKYDPMRDVYYGYDKDGMPVKGGAITRTQLLKYNPTTTTQKVLGAVFDTNHGLDKGTGQPTVSNAFQEVTNE